MRIIEVTRPRYKSSSSNIIFIGRPKTIVTKCRCLTQTKTFSVAVEILSVRCLADAVRLANCSRDVDQWPQNFCQENEATTHEAENEDLTSLGIICYTFSDVRLLTASAAVIYGFNTRGPVWNPIEQQVSAEHPPLLTIKIVESFEQRGWLRTLAGLHLPPCMALILAQNSSFTVRTSPRLSVCLTCSVYITDWLLSGAVLFSSTSAAVQCCFCKSKQTSMFAIKHCYYDWVREQTPWVGLGWIGLDWVAENGPMSMSERA